MRYRCNADGKLEKQFNGLDEDGWVKTKAEARAAAGAVEISGNDAGTDYATWKFPALRAEHKIRTGKGFKVGTTKPAAVELLRQLDAQAG